MSGDPDDAPRADRAQSSHNPEGEMPEDPATAEPHEGRNVSGQEADEAARRAIDAEGPSRDDVIDQSAYRDNAADPGQQAADADRAESD